MNKDYLNQFSFIKKKIESFNNLDEIYERISNGAIISFAQNYEDIILERIFKEKNIGFYIDVGCFHPVIKSITCNFYLKGWRGINIDVSKENIERFDKFRPLDKNIYSLIGSKNTKEDVYILEGTTRSTKKKELGDLYIKEGKNVSKKKISQRTLNSILNEIENLPEIDFLSIDVEGAELDVLKGLNLKKYRPKVILAEAVFPVTNIPDYHDWEPILLNAGYELIYIDGLNRFYMDNPSSFIREKLKLPPNYYDNFVRYELINALINNKF